MKLYEAKVADILRSSQRDVEYVNDIQDYITSILQYFGERSSNRIRKIVPVLANAWYYSITSLCNLQTIGEEYAGIIRVDNNKVPTKLLQIFWLSLYIGGEPLVDKLFDRMQIMLNTNKSLTQTAKIQMLKIVSFFKENKLIFMRLHYSIFYMNGVYYNVSNRLAGIKYALLRQWMEDDTSTGSFKLLGKASLFYLLFFLVQQNWQIINETKFQTTNSVSTSSKICALCADNRKNVCCTPCGHLFCWDCINDGLQYQPSCPICREPIKSSRIILLQNYS